MKEIMYKDVPLSEEELEEAIVQVAQLKSRLETNALNLKHLEIDEKNKYSERLSVLNARKSIQDIKKHLEMDNKTTESNLKMFEDQVKNKTKKEPIEEEEEVEEVIEEKKE